jgi:hypothetical protein
MEKVLIIGTGLIGASTGLALRAAGFGGRIDGWDQSLLELRAALEMGAIDQVAGDEFAALELARKADVILLAVPVLAIKGWMKKLAEVTGPGQLITDVGSTKLEITELAAELFGREDRASLGQLPPRTPHGRQGIRRRSAGGGQPLPGSNVALHSRPRTAFRDGEGVAQLGQLLRHSHARHGSPQAR